MLLSYTYISSILKIFLICNKKIKVEQINYSLRILIRKIKQKKLASLCTLIFDKYNISGTDFYNTLYNFLNHCFYSMYIKQIKYNIETWSKVRWKNDACHWTVSGDGNISSKDAVIISLCIIQPLNIEYRLFNIQICLTGRTYYTYLVLEKQHVNGLFGTCLVYWFSCLVQG